MVYLERGVNMKASHVIAHTIFLTAAIWLIIYFAGGLLGYEPQNVDSVIWVITPVVSFLIVLFLHLNSEAKERY
jgi:hypothetical protein